MDRQSTLQLELHSTLVLRCISITHVWCHLSQPLTLSGHKLKWLVGVRTVVCSIFTGNTANHCPDYTTMVHCRVDLEESTNQPRVLPQRRLQTITVSYAFKLCLIANAATRVRAGTSPCPPQSATCRPRTHAAAIHTVVACARGVDDECEVRSGYRGCTPWSPHGTRSALGSSLG